MINNHSIKPTTRTRTTEFIAGKHTDNSNDSDTAITTFSSNDSRYSNKKPVVDVDVNNTAAEVKNLAN